MLSARYSCQILTKLDLSRQIFEKYLNIKFHENPSGGSRVVPCGRTDTTKLTVAFSYFVNAPKKTVPGNTTNVWRRSEEMSPALESRKT